MALVRFERRFGWDPVADLLDLTNLYGDALLDLPKLDDGYELELPAIWHPAVDVYEDGDNIIVKMDLPGLTKEDIDISFDGHVLSITGQRKEDEVKSQARGYWSRERFKGNFHRYIHLPMEVSDNLNARFTDGVLEVTLPKTEKNKVKKILIGSGEAKKE